MTSATLWIRTTSTGPTGKERSTITAAVILLTASSPSPDQVKHPVGLEYTIVEVTCSFS